MADTFTLTELKGSRDFGTGSRERAEWTYRVVQTTTDPELVPDPRGAIDAVLAEAPVLYEGMPRNGAECKAIDGRDDFIVSVSYGARQTVVPSAAIGSPTFSFPSSTSTQNITQAISERKYGDGAPLNGVINQTPRGVEGVDVEVGDHIWVETHIFAASAVTFASQVALRALRKKVNNAQFRGFAIGEVFFVEVEMEQRNEDEWEYRFTFRASNNRLVADGDPLTIGTITDIEKLGHEYLWVKYREEESGGNVVETAEAVYVDEVYEATDFSQLGIGTSVPY